MVNKFKALVISMLILTFGLTAFNTYQIFQITSLGGSSAKAVKKPSDYKFGVKYEKALEAKKPMALLFYADWCRYCIGFMPEYEKLYKKFKRKYNFVKINVEDPNYREEVVKYQIDGFPTLYLVNPITDKSVHVDNGDFHSNERMTENLNSFYEVNFLEKELKLDETVKDEKVNEDKK